MGKHRTHSFDISNCQPAVRVSQFSFGSSCFSHCWRLFSHVVLPLCCVKCCHVIPVSTLWSSFLPVETVLIVLLSWYWVRTVWLFLQYTLLHIAPPCSAPDVIAKSALADTAGYVDVHRDTLQHNKYKNVFAIGDCSSAPTAKTAAAVGRWREIKSSFLMWWNWQER